VKSRWSSSAADWSMAFPLSDVCLREERKDLVYLGEVRIDFLLVGDS